MRGQRQRHLAVRVLEEHGVAREGVEGRRLDAAVSIRRQVVGPQRVDRDEDDRRGRPPPAGRREHGEERGRRRDAPTPAQRTRNGAEAVPDLPVAASWRKTRSA